MDNYNTVYQNNTGFIFCYKSTRKNAKTSDIINIGHLISDKPDRKMSDDRIIDQIISTIDKIIYYSKQFNHIEISCYLGILQQVEYKNSSNEIYHDAEKHRYAFQRVQFYNIESCINYVFNIYSLIYPYNKISYKTLHNNASIRYLINQYYNHEEPANND